MATKKKKTKKKQEPVSSCEHLPTSEAESTAPIGVSMKSDSSMYEPMSFAPGETQRLSSESTASSDVSMKSDSSMYYLPENFDNETQSQLTCSVCEEALKDPVSSEQSDSPADVLCTKCGKKLRRDPEQQRDTVEETWDSHLLKANTDLKEALQTKFALISEGSDDPGSPLNKIYSEPIITTGETEGPHNHSVTSSNLSAWSRETPKDSPDEGFCRQRKIICCAEINS